MSNIIEESENILECICCLEPIDQNDENEQGWTSRDGEPMCQSCYYSDTQDPDVTIKVHHSKGDELYENFDLIFIGGYNTDSSDSEFENDFRKEDHYSDWRGYTDVVSDTWKEIGLVNVRAFDYYSKDLENMVEEFTNTLLDKGIIYATAQARTSNCMVVNLTYWVQNENYDKAMRLKKKLIKKYKLNEDDL